MAFTACLCELVPEGRHFIVCDAYRYFAG